MFSTRLRALSVFVVLAAAGSGLLLAQSSQEVGTWVGVGAADNPFGNGAQVDVGDGHTLIVGGTAPDGAATNVVANFDTATNQFAIAGTLLSARTGHTATLLKDGRVLVAGGTTNSLVSTDIELFDPSTGSSTLVAQMAEPRRGHVAALLQNGNVLIAGGYTTGDVVLQSAFLFDPATNAVSPTPGGLQVARASASATSLIDGRVVIVGGTDGTNDLRSAEIYDPYLQSFTTASTQLSVPVHGHSAVLLPNNGSVLIAGGTSNGVAQAGAELFLPAEFPDPFSWGMGQFAPTASMSVARSSAIAGPSATEGYAVVTGGGSNDVERYRFATIKTDKDDYAPGEHALITGTGWQPGEQVTLTFQEDPGVHDDYVLTLTADGQGNISTTQWAPEQHDLNVRFYLMARGSRSKAQTTFTDGLRVNVKRDTPTSATLTVAHGSTTPVTFEIENNNNSGDQSTSLTVSYTLSVSGSVSAAGAPLTGSVTLANDSASVFRSWNITASGPPFTGTVTLTATITSPACSPAGSNTCSSSATYIFTITPPADSTPPVITPNIVGTLGSNGWYTSNVDLTWTVSDPESSVTSSTGCGPSSVTADTSGTSFTCSATSTGGTSSQSVTIKRDASAPNPPTGTKSPAANGAGWNNSDVTVSFLPAGDVGPSGGVTCSSSVVQSVETASTDLVGSCTDAAGNESADTVVNVKLDKSAPTDVVGTPARPPDHNGWYTAPVVVTFTGVDALSNIASCTSTNYSGPDGTGVSVGGSCTDNAGNTTSSSFSLNYDATAPSISGSRAPAANPYGWNNTDVTVSFSCTDATSGLAAGSPPADTVLSTEDAGQSVGGTCTDNAGHTASTTVSGINIDKTAPSISASRLPVANANGWNNTDVTATYNASDALSGLVDPATGTHTFSAEGAGQEHTFTVLDKAGNSASAMITDVNIDKTAPDVTPNRNPPPNANGWNNTNVTVGYTATDTLSELTSPATDSFTFTGEGANQSHSFTVSDKAGNSSPVSFTVSIDKTVPSISGSRLPLANAYGWNNTDVAVSFLCSDSLSGLAAGSPPPPTVLSGEGAGQSVPGTCIDLAGNTASTTVSGINIDKTAPVVLVTGVSQGATYTLGAVPAAGCNTTDALSGVATAAVVSVSVGIPPGVGPFTATCSGATDKAGNAASNVAVSYTVQFASGSNVVCNGAPGHQVLQPINLTGSSVFPKKGGSTVPIKFRVCGIDGVSVGPTPVVQNFQLVSVINGTPGEVNETDIESTNSDTAFRWSASDAQWIFNLSTKNLNAGRTYVYLITLYGGSTIEFRFALK